MHTWPDLGVVGSQVLRNATIVVPAKHQTAGKSEILLETGRNQDNVTEKIEYLRSVQCMCRSQWETTMMYYRGIAIFCLFWYSGFIRDNREQA